MIAAADNNNVGQELAACIIIDGRHVSKTRLRYGRKKLIPASSKPELVKDTESTLTKITRLCVIRAKVA